jgi:polysaccharide export outer membrane protein
MLASCAGRGGSIPYDGVALTPPDKPSSTEEVYDIPLGPLDLLQIKVFRVPELSGDFQVDAMGHVNLPLIGTVSTRDLRTDAFAASLERLYSERYLQNPDITVRVLSTSRTSVTVEGGVREPGIYPLTSKTTLVGAIAMSRGIDTLIGNPKRVAIFRKIDGKTAAAAFDLIAIRHGKMDDPTIYPGDTIVVDSDQLRQTYRELLQVIPIFAIFQQI